jgi:pimeloyl-ACP methyl ester carboxylesterase
MPHDAIRIHYEVEGAGTPLVLMHGALVGLEMWRELGYTGALRDDHRLILIDARGHGRSEAPHDPAYYRPELMAGDVTAVLDALEIPAAHFLGASLGAAIGFESWPGFEEDLPHMALPCLLVAAESDAFHTSARCAALLPQATFVTLPGGDHAHGSYRPERVLPHARAFWESLITS